MSDRATFAVILSLVVTLARADGTNAGPIQTLASTVANGITSPEVAVSHSGVTLVAWVVGTPAGNLLLYQLFDRTGAPLGVTQTIAGTGLRRPRIAAGVERFMLSFEEIPAGATRYALTVRIIDSAGNSWFQGSPELPSIAAAFDAVDSSCCATIHDQFAVSWIRRSPAGLPQGVMLRRFDGQGTMFDAQPITIAAQAVGFGFERDTAVAWWPDGNLLMAWVDGPPGAGPGVSSPDGQGQAIIGQFFGPGLIPLSGRVLLAGQTVGDQNEPRLAAATRGIGIVSYISTASGAARACFARIINTGQTYDPLGVTANSGAAGPDRATGLAMAANGDAIICFSSPATTGGALPRIGYARLRSPFGFPAAPVFDTGTFDTTAGAQDRAVAGLDPYGNVKAAWVRTGAGSDTLAFRTLDRTQVTLLQPPQRGATVSILLDSPSDPGFAYLLLASTGVGPIALDLREIRLTFDPLVQLILTGPLPFFSGFSGTLDAVGQTTAPVFAIPNLTWLAGQTLHFAMLTADPWGISPSGINTISDTVTVVIQ